MIHYLNVFLVTLILVWNSSALMAQDPPAGEDRSPELQWWKGNLHTHSLWSDGDDFPEMIADWYLRHDYNFLAISDHNVLARGERWMSLSDIERRGGQTALGKYRQRFGNAWVQTRPKGNSLEVRLKPLDEYRYLVEQREQFIVIPAEEISDRAEGKPVHMNATNLAEVIKPVGGETVREAMQNNLRAVQEQAERLGREILLHLNHPNFGWAVTAEDLAAVTQERFYEVYNGHPGVNSLGDAERPSVERIWDLANAIRIGALREPALYGIATDDSHDYHGQPGSHTGRGWVMVRSRYLTPEFLIGAMKQGDFYASSGVTLSELKFDPAKRSLRIKVDAQPGASYNISFIGTRQGNGKARPSPEQIGLELAAFTDSEAVYQLDPRDLYVRAVITSSQDADDPSFKNQKKQAWTQPVGWQEFLSKDGGQN